MATYVVGDIQGCFDQFQCLLEKVSFNPDRDVIWSVGDLITADPTTLRHCAGFTNGVTMQWLSWVTRSTPDGCFSRRTKNE